jgi:hypothetical protein
MSELKRAKLIAAAISPWLYSVGPPPEGLNTLFLDWIDCDRVASLAEIKAALREAKKEKSNVKP